MGHRIFSLLVGIILVIGLMPSLNLQKAYADDDATANEDAPAVVEGGEAGDAALAPADDVSSIDEDFAALSDFDADVISAFALDSGVRPLATGAFAIYSSDDQSLSFYYGDVPTAGGTYNGKAATTVYTNFTFSSADYVAWDGRRSYTASVFVDDSFSAFKPSSTAYWFYDFTSCTSFTGMENLNMSNATNMTYMFYSCTSLESLDLSGWDTPSVTNMSYMFYSCTSLESLDLSGWDASSATRMNHMFSLCTNLTSLTGLSGWDTPSVTNMNNMFYSCTSLESLDLSGWDTPSVTNMSYMFFTCTSLVSLTGLSGWDTSSVTNMNEMFHYDASLESLDLSGWNTSKVSNYSRFLGGAGGLDYITIGDDFNLFTHGGDGSAVISDFATWYKPAGEGSMIGTAVTERGVSGAGTYYTAANEITIVDNEYGTTTAWSGEDLINTAGEEKDKVIYAGTVTVRVDPKDDVKCLGLTVTGDTSGDEIPVTRISNGNTAVYSFEMPKEPVTVVAELDTFSVTYAVAGVDEGGSVSGATYAAEGYPVTFTVTIEDGYVLVDLTVIGDESGTVPGNVYQSGNEYLFIMPGESVTVTATFAVERTSIDDAVVTGIDDRYDYTGGAITPEPTVTLPDGTVLVKDRDYTVEYLDNVEPGTATVVITGIGDYEGTVEVTFVINADKSALQELVDTVEGLNEYGYTPESWQAMEDALIAAKDVEADPDATQAEVDAVTEALNEAMDNLKIWFHDVTDPDLWYFDAVYGMAEQGFITGYYDDYYGDGTDVLIFNHGGIMDRAQLATILWRMAGEPEVEGGTVFTDVDYSEYYGMAVRWAYEEGVITGYDDAEGNLIFDPSGALDFEAMVAMTARASIGADAVAAWPTDSLDSGRFSDADQVSDWACTAMAWAIDCGLVTGGDNGDGTYTLDPGDHTARGRAVTVLWRAYCENIL